MTTLSFTSDAARRLESLYMTRDVVSQRAATLERLGLSEGESILDVGSGPGFLAESIADSVGSSGRVVGVDISHDLVARSTRRNGRSWLSFRTADATALDEPDVAYDAVVCTQVAEYIADVDTVISEVGRVLKPGGRFVFVATDWDGVIWHSGNPERMSRIMRSWEAHCAHPRLPRSFKSRLARAGLRFQGATVFPILNLTWDDDSYSKGLSALIRDFVGSQGGIDAGTVSSWYDELGELSDSGRYFFSSARFIFCGSKPDSALGASKSAAGSTLPLEASWPAD
jgi:arsenite methyltransferase